MNLKDRLAPLLQTFIFLESRVRSSSFQFQEASSLINLPLDLLFQNKLSQQVDDLSLVNLEVVRQEVQGDSLIGLQFLLENAQVDASQQVGEVLRNEGIVSDACLRVLEDSLDGFDVVRFHSCSQVDHRDYLSVVFEHFGFSGSRVVDV